MTDEMEWPPLPRVFHAPAGPLKVVKILNPTVRGEPCSGFWDSENNILAIKSVMPRQVQWQVYFHEAFHVILEQTGVRLRLKLEESLCDAYATARMAEMRAALLGKATRKKAT
jgi:hypothetical protein